MGTAPKAARKRKSLPPSTESLLGSGLNHARNGSHVDPEQASRIYEERYRVLFKKNLAGVFLTRMDGEIVDCNESFARMMGYVCPEDIRAGCSQDLYFSESDRAEFLKKLVAERSLSNLESRLKRRDGSELWVVENVVLVGEGPDALIQGTAIDITERKRAERAIRESEIKFRAVADMASSAICIHNLRRFIYVNRASVEISGYSEDELMQLQPLALVPSDFREAASRHANGFGNGHKAITRSEFPISTKQGETRWLDLSAGSILFGGQQATLCTAFDITERKRAEELQTALYRISDCSHSAVDLQQLYPAIHKIIGELICAENFYIALLDPAGERLLFPYFVDAHEPHPKPRYLGKGLTEYVMRAGQTVLVDRTQIKSLLERGEIEDIGAEPVDWMGAPLKAGDLVIGVAALQSYDERIRYAQKEKEILTFVSQHIAGAIHRKRKEEALRDSEARYRSLVQSAVYGIYRSSVDDCFLDVNPALVSMLGYDSPEELLKVSLVRDVYVDPEQRMRLVIEHQKHNFVQNVEVKWRRKDGRIIIVRLSGRAIADNEGRTTNFEMIAEDVTERRSLEDQLRHSQKMEAIGQLAGGVAHDFNNLLTVIKGYSELMLDELQGADPLRCEVLEIKKAADRAAGLTRQLLAFSRQQVLAPKVLDLNAVVQNMEKLLQRLLGDDVLLALRLESHLGRIKADPGQIEQVIMNLAVNARDAMPNGGRLTIETMNIDLDTNYTRDHAAVKPGPYVMIAVSDNGEGMTEQIRNRIFEPFFTTKEVGKGTGLGLSTVYGIVKQSDGYIWVYSELGIGSTFKVYLPRVDAPADFAPHRNPNAEVYAGKETILLVEDEDGVRSLVRQLLTRCGYSVLEARHGGEAILLCERHPGPIDLLVTDVVLEHIGGRDLAKRLSNVRPGMRVLFVSGYADDAIVQHGVLNPGAQFLQKPFTTEALAKKVRQILDAATVPA